LYKEVAAFFRSRTPFSVPYEDARETIKLLNAFYVSDEKGSYVEVAVAGDSTRLGRQDEALANLYRTDK
jgi:UDP-N-acetyl-2-amino-2-deoxyglucuronate dehydrogenase